MFDKPMQETLNFWDSERGGGGWDPLDPPSGSAYAKEKISSSSSSSWTGVNSYTSVNNSSAAWADS